MHVTLHLTNACNMACDYCYVDHNAIKAMPRETAFAAVELAGRLTPERASSGIIFFGGEPLLHKELIRETIAHAETLETATNRFFHFKATTNGLLLDDEFLTYSAEKNLFLALSMDGCPAAHDMHRVDTAGMGTAAAVEKSALALLRARPYAPVMMTVNPDTAPLYAQSVKYLYGLGFRYLICSLNYAAPWTEADMDVLQAQYRELAEYYYKLTMAEEKFYLSPFEVKISSYINQKTYCAERCELGKKQISVAPDGLLYPCVQFVGDEAFAIGDVRTGIDEERRQALYARNEREKDSCVGCAVAGRCNHYCGCLNRQATGSIDLVSPVQCAHERLLLPIADKLAARLYRRRSAMFIQKHYNDFYPLVSLVEDRTAGRG